MAGTKRDQYTSLYTTPLDPCVWRKAAAYGQSQHGRSAKLMWSCGWWIIERLAGFVYRKADCMAATTGPAYTGCLA